MIVDMINLSKNSLTLKMIILGIIDIYLFNKFF